MTGMVVRIKREGKGAGSNPLALLEPAFSDQTKEITRRVQALQNHPALGSPLERVSVSGEKATQEDLFDALAGVKILTSQVAMHLDGEWRTKLFRQLDSLHDPAEWEEGDQPIQQASFATFLKAM